MNQLSRFTAGYPATASSAARSLVWRRKTIGPRSARRERSPSRNPPGVITTTRHRRVLNGIGTENRGASCKPWAARVCPAARSTTALAASDQPR